MDDRAEHIAEIQSRYASGEDFTNEDIDLIADIAIESIRVILSAFNEENSAIDEYEGDDGELILDIDGDDLVLLIGRHGRTLEAFQSLVSSIVSRKLGFRYPIVIDIKGYKSARREKICMQGLQAAERAKEQQRPISLPPMNAYERRLVHLALVPDEEVTTVSEGIEPRRYVVVCPVS